MCRISVLYHANLFPNYYQSSFDSCRVFMDVTIRIIHRSSHLTDELMSDFPCFVTIQGNHNHPLDAADALNQLQVHPPTREMFEKYFEQGIVKHS